MHWHLDWTTVHSGHLNQSWWTQPDDFSHCMIYSIFSKVHEMGAECGCDCQRSQELWRSEKSSHWQVWPPDLCFPEVSDSCLQPHIHDYSQVWSHDKTMFLKEIDISIHQVSAKMANDYISISNEFCSLNILKNFGIIQMNCWMKTLKWKYN